MVESIGLYGAQLWELNKKLRLWKLIIGDDFADLLDSIE